MDLFNNNLLSRLENRKKQGLYRQLSVENSLVDFASNDYLGFAKITEQVPTETNLENTNKLFGSTGSRLITGNTEFVTELESFIANYHNAPSGLIFNSGYDANLGLFSSVPQKGDTVIYDEYIHASIRDGIRLSYAQSFSFKHNDTENLKDKVKRANGNVFVVVESVYSMDGDFAPLNEIAQLCQEYKSALIVDEAHASGIFGEKGAGRVVELNLEDKTFARIHTFGKALGCHGAIVLGNECLRDFLINFSRPFIYTTALPLSALINIKAAYLKLNSAGIEIIKIKKSIDYFKSNIKIKDSFELIDSYGPVQCIIIPGIEKVKFFAESIRKSGFDVRAILSPTVPAGKERVRICIHSFNTEFELKDLVSIINSITFEKVNAI